jgi:hypothetical protein
MANDPSNNHFADPVYDNGYKFQLRLTVKNEKMEKRINYLVEANNELMKELEQWERVGTRLEKATLSPEEEQIVRMPWLKEHTNG